MAGSIENETRRTTTAVIRTERVAEKDNKYHDSYFVIRLDLSVRLSGAEPVRRSSRFSSIILVNPDMFYLLDRNCREMPSPAEVTANQISLALLMDSD